MTRTEFNRAFELARDNSLDLSDVDERHLHGCGLPDFQRVMTTIAPVAKLLRWQCLMLNGDWDQEALTEMRRISRRNFELVGPGSDASAEDAKGTADTLRLITTLCS